VEPLSFSFTSYEDEELVPVKTVGERFEYFRRSTMDVIDALELAREECRGEGQGGYFTIDYVSGNETHRMEIEIKPDGGITRLED